MDFVDFVIDCYSHITSHVFQVFASCTHFKKLTWLQTYVLGDLGVIWCNSLGDSLFQIYVMNFVKIVLDYYSHITLHVSQGFASCTHYTS